MNETHLVIKTFSPRGENVTLYGKLNVNANHSKVFNRLQNAFRMKHEKISIKRSEEVCPNCAFNIECFDENVSFVKPTKCSFEEKVDKVKMIEYLKENPLLIIGDSRTLHLQLAITSVLTCNLISQQVNAN